MELAPDLQPQAGAGTKVARHALGHGNTQTVRLFRLQRLAEILELSAQVDVRACLEGRIMRVARNLGCQLLKQLHCLAKEFFSLTVPACSFQEKGEPPLLMTQ